MFLCLPRTSEVVAIGDASRVCHCVGTLSNIDIWRVNIGTPLLEFSPLPFQLVFADECGFAARLCPRRVPCTLPTSKSPMTRRCSVLQE